MELIRKLGTKFINGRWVRYGQFLCPNPICNKLVERRIDAGYKQNSCGCLHYINIDHNNIKHGETNTKLYQVWRDMKNRCNNPKNKRYKDYGGRGITICPEWTESYIVFRDWVLNNGYAERLQINRINNNGNYEPSNCNFITAKENMQNRRKYKKGIL